MRPILLMSIASALLSGCDSPQGVADVRKTSPVASVKSVTPKASPAPVSNDKPPVPEAKPERIRTEREEEPKPEKDPPIPTNAKPLNKNKTLYFETMPDGSRRVLLLATVVLREGPLEVFLCKFQTKEHEAILNCDVDAREVHTALVAARAVPGTTVKFVPKYEAATGSKIKVTMTYFFQGKEATHEARYFVRDVKTGKELAHDWVFAGSRLEKNPVDQKEMFYYANNGEVIALSNFPDSMMDLPIESTDKNSELQFEAWTDRIPPRGTKVLVALEPVVEKKGN